MNHKAGAGQWCSSDFHPKFRILYFSEIYQFEIDHFLILRGRVFSRIFNSA